MERADKFLERSSSSRKAIGKMLVDRFLRDGTVVMVHGLSRVILAVLQLAHERGKRLTVMVTECRTPTRNWGWEMAQRITEIGLSVELVLDSSVARVMQDVDIVIFGAEGVVENGGVINTVGTYQTSLVAHSLRVPVYVVAESFKFVRHFPLNQNDVPQFRDVNLNKELGELVCGSCSFCRHRS